MREQNFTSRIREGQNGEIIPLIVALCFIHLSFLSIIRKKKDMEKEEWLCLTDSWERRIDKKKGYE